MKQRYEWKNQLTYCQEKNSFVYCFPIEKDVRDFKISGISEQSFGPIYSIFKKLIQRCFHSG